MSLRRHRFWQVVVLVTVLSEAVACVKWPGGEVGSTHGDRTLFERTINAVEQERYDAANLMLQTLVNTYPDSEYAGRATLLLEDPRIAQWNSTRGCDGRFDSPTPSD